MVTLTVYREVFQKLNKTFLSSEQEEGFILGCRTRLNCVDVCEQVPAIQAGIHYYKPNSSYANWVIQKWRKQGICFCGFIHSHVTNKQDLSEADLQYAEALIQAYTIPILWFGLAVTIDGHISYHFYSVTRKNGNVHISPVSFKKTDFREDHHESLYC